MDKSIPEKLEITAERLGIISEQIPRNIAIIMDGNGRWAEEKGLPRVKGHREGGKTVEKIALASVDLGLESLTLYSFSMENWSRPKNEVEALMHLYTQYLIGIRPMMTKNNVKLLHIGRIDNLPQKLVDELQKSIDITKDNTGLKLAIALNYSGRMEILDAAKNIAQLYKDGKIKLEEIDQNLFAQNLYCPHLPEPDLLIRTANELRVSNFLLWQISYSEFYVTEKFWPDFDRQELEKAILTYAARTRRFGNIKPTAKNDKP